MASANQCLECGSPITSENHRPTPFGSPTERWESCTSCDWGQVVNLRTERAEALDGASKMAADLAFALGQSPFAAGTRRPASDLRGGK